VAEQGTWRTVLGHATIRALVLICLLSVVIESVVFVWSVIYLRDELHSPAVVGGVGFALFNSAMFVGRILNTPLVARYGMRASLMFSGLGLVLAAVLLLVAHQIALAIAALALLGLGVAGIFPTIVGAAGDILPGKSGLLTGVIMSSAYVAFMVTPPIVGWIAELNSWRAAMLLVLVSGAAVLGLAARLPRLAVDRL
jgi:MFS family permease